MCVCADEWDVPEHLQPPWEPLAAPVATEVQLDDWDLDKKCKLNSRR